jgi:hypothetical protein
MKRAFAHQVLADLLEFNAGLTDNGRDVDAGFEFFEIGSRHLASRKNVCFKIYRLCLILSMSAIFNARQHSLNFIKCKDEQTQTRRSL